MPMSRKNFYDLKDIRANEVCLYSIVCSVSRKDSKLYTSFCIIFTLTIGHCNCLTLVLLNPNMPCLTNSVDPDQLASEEANWSGSALFAIKYVNIYKKYVIK